MSPYFYSAGASTDFVCQDGALVGVMYKFVSNTAFTAIAGSPIALGYPVKNTDFSNSGCLISNQTDLPAALAVL